MNTKAAPLAGCWIITPTLHSDGRGQFVETFQHKRFAQQTDLSINFTQDNEVTSTKGVVRGLHLQTTPHAQAKLIRVVQGQIYDVALDLRKDSPNYGKWFGLVLTAKAQTQLFIPKGFAHGYSVLSDTAIIQYKVDGDYHPESERGVRFDDPNLGIDWQVATPIVSDKDLKLPLFKDFQS
jgi:dTDP-4-dehydrorhamnose 3,5-epimerase